jgi:DNA-directed RNA polymerase specialized sigma24 family protein
MMDTPTFADFIRRVRLKDEAAVARLVEEYGPMLGRVIAKKLAGFGLGRLLDAEDIADWVLGRFCVLAAAGHFQLAQPEDLRKLLVTMARNRLRDRARHFCPDGRRGPEQEPSGGKALEEWTAAEQDPGESLARQELFDKLRWHLSEEEWRLASARAEGQSWEELAAAWGQCADTLRMRLRRAVERVRRTLELDPGDV